MSTSLHKVLTLGASALLLIAAASCLGDDQPPNNPKLDGTYINKEGVVWPDYGSPVVDMWVPNSPDKGQTNNDGGGSTDGSGPADGGDGGGSTDSGGACPGPSGVKCAPTCTSKEICTAAKKSTCATAYTLSGPASNKKALLIAALAFLDCWNKQATADRLCSTFDACGMTGTMSAGLLKSWVCNLAQVSDFPSAAKHKATKTVFGCGTFDTTRPDWKVSTIPAKKRGTICLSYNSISWWPDRIEVNNCASYPPK